MSGMGVTEASIPMPSLGLPLVSAASLVTSGTWSPTSSFFKTACGTLQPHPLSLLKFVSLKLGLSPCSEGLNSGLSL